MEQNLNVKNRSDCKITGVNEIVSSDDKEVIISLIDNSLLMIKGKNIKIISYNSDSINIMGKLNSFTYSN